MKHLTILLAFLMTLSSPVMGQDFDKGFAAAQAGDYATALKEWAPLAELGFAYAEYNLGLLYYNGQGVIQDYEEASNLFMLAAIKGNADAQSKLGFTHYFGHGFPKNNAKAHVWWNIASANGNEIARDARDLIAEGMTPKEILEAQALAKECMSGSYAKCLF